MELIKYELSRKVLHIHFNRPEKRNALNRSMRHYLIELLQQKAKDHDLQFTGEGPCFCAGLDIKEELTKSDLDDFRLIIKIIRDHPLSTTSYINGTVRGGGLILARSCQTLIASESSNFSIPDIAFSKNPFVKEALNEYITENDLFQALSTDEHPWTAFMALESGLIDAIHS